MRKTNKTAHINILSSLLEVFTNKQKWVLLLFTIGNMFGALLESLAVALMLPFISSVTVSAPEGSGKIVSYVIDFFHCETQSELAFVFALILALLYVFKGAYQLTLRIAQERKFARFRIGLSVSLFHIVMHKPYRYHLSHNTSETLRMVTTDVDRTFTTLNCYMTLISEGCVGIGILVVLLTVDVVLTLSAIVLIGIILLVADWFVVRKIKQQANINWQSTTCMLKWVQQAIGALKNVYVNRKQAFFVDHYSQHADSVANSNATSSILAHLPKMLIETISMVSVFLFIAVASKRGSSFETLLPLLTTFAVAIIRLIPTANRVTDAITTANFRRPSVDTVYRMIRNSKDDALEYTSKGSDSPGYSDLPAFHHMLEVKDVTFVHQGATEPVLNHISLKIPVNHSVGIVGPTGSGKTTLADVILGLQIPQSGTVSADGHDIFQSRDWWSNQIGYVPQFIYLCDDTIRFNVALGYKEDETDNDRVWKCLEMAQMKQFVESLPNGIYTLTGENGQRLSGGQRQRIGIARALYSDPQMLVFDEATSALDNETETALVETINNLSRRKTLFIIAHRLSTIRQCDSIYRIQDGVATREDRFRLFRNDEEEIKKENEE